MTLDLWETVREGGAPFVLFLMALLFFTGKLVNGEIARQARIDALEANTKAHEEQITLMKQRFEEMQAVWRDRCQEVTQDRDYYRNIALSFARHAEELLALAREKLPRS